MAIHLLQCQGRMTSCVVTAFYKKTPAITTWFLFHYPTYFYIISWRDALAENASVFYADLILFDKNRTHHSESYSYPLSFCLRKNINQSNCIPCITASWLSHLQFDPTQSIFHPALSNQPVLPVNFLPLVFPDVFLLVFPVVFPRSEEHTSELQSHLT